MYHCVSLWIATLPTLDVSVYGNTSGIVVRADSGCCDDLLAFAFVHGAELCNSGLWRVWSKGLMLFIREGIWVDKCLSSLHTSCSCSWSMREYSFSTFILSENIRYLVMH